jgi:hypothetical protein
LGSGISFSIVVVFAARAIIVIVFAARAIIVVVFAARAIIVVVFAARAIIVVVSAARRRLGATIVAMGVPVAPDPSSVKTDVLVDLNPASRV